MSSDEITDELNSIYIQVDLRLRSDDRNRCNMQKKESNFLLYENRSIMNAIRPESVCLGSGC